MKILSIRGCNLASLKGPFELDLMGEVLQGAGLFAITGPTGSGKTTLLDALCLALFNRTPRQGAGGLARIGHRAQAEKERITASDVRNLLRRGTGSGWAEVSFLGVDDRQYTARWAVRRARERPTGRLRESSLTLVDVATGQPLGGTKKETLAATAEKLGLSFHQFCRSALLPQGDFAAFLRASEKDRAALLERITGTSIYSRISREVFGRSKRESAEVERLETQLELLGLLTSERRAELEEVIEERRAALTGELTVEAELQAEVAWFQRLEALDKQESRAAVDLKAAERAWHDAADSRQRLDEAEQAELLRPWLVSRDRCRAEEDAARESVARASEARDEAAAAAKAAVRTAEVARGSRERATRALSDAGPELERAAELDLRLKSQRSQLRERESEAAAAREKALSADAEVRALETSLRRSAEALAEASDWLASRGSIRPLAEGWSRAEGDLNALVAAAEARAGLEEERRGLHDREERAGQAVATARASLGACDVALDSAGAALKKLAGQLPVVGREELTRRRESLGVERELAREAGALATRARGLTGKAESTETRLHAARVEREAARARADELARGLLQERGRLRGVEESLERVRLEADLADRRHHLREGEPCPLCGSLEHPAASRAVVPGAVERLEQDLDAARLGVEAQVKEQGEQEAGRRAAARRIEELEAALLAVRSEQEECVAAWSGLDSRVSEAVGAAQPGCSEAEEAVAGWSTRLDAARVEIDRLEALITAHERAGLDARATLEEARADRDAAATRLRERERELVETSRQLDDVVGRRAVQEDRRDRAIEALAPLLDHREGWRVELAADPRGASARLSTEVRVWQEKHRDQAALQQRLDDLTRRRDVQKDGARAQAGFAEEQETAASRSRAELTVTEKQRLVLLGGRPTGEVRGELERAVSAAEEALETGRRAHDARARAAAEAHAVAEEARRRLVARQQALREAVDELGGQLDQRGLPEASVSGWLLAPEALEELRTRIRALEQRRGEASAVLEELREQTRTHREERAPERTAVESLAALTEARDRVRAAREQVGEAEFPLRSDDANQSKASELRPQLEEQRGVAGIWADLDALVGQADGSKFRKYAQGLTLERLLLQANGHLEELVPRYRLERIPGGAYDMELQVVDRDMGDEVRPVTSLSGGESFLVSLALALGLSSLSASDTSVDSLFIDEGFGTLDSDTLAVAVSVLDALQARGRQVGVISHVEGLANDIGVRVEVVRVAPGWSKVLPPTSPSC